MPSGPISNSFNWCFLLVLSKTTNPSIVKNAVAMRFFWNIWTRPAIIKSANAVKIVARAADGLYRLPDQVIILWSDFGVGLSKTNSESSSGFGLIICLFLRSIICAKRATSSYNLPTINPGQVILINLKFSIPTRLERNYFFNSFDIPSLSG